VEAASRLDTGTRKDSHRHHRSHLFTGGDRGSQGRTQGRRRACHRFDEREQDWGTWNERSARPLVSVPILMAISPQVDKNSALSQSPEAVIVVEEIHKYYDLGQTRVHALRGVSVSIAHGEFVTIMGSSGSGKSTFMNILGCLDKPSAGRYLLGGVEVSA